MLKRHCKIDKINNLLPNFLPKNPPSSILDYNEKRQSAAELTIGWLIKTDNLTKIRNKPKNTKQLYMTLPSCNYLLFIVNYNILRYYYMGYMY